MKTLGLDHGVGSMVVDVPDSTVVVRYGETYTDPPVVDPVAATRRALDAPLGLPPLRELAGPGRTAAIFFPDRVKGGAHPTAHRRVAIPMIVEDLLAGGCRLEDITLVCAQGLHRRNTIEEWRWYLGADVVDRFWPDRLVNHDAEAPDLLGLGATADGDAVQTHPLLAHVDVPILVGHCAANPYGGFSGGYKMLVTGLAGRASIASHHAPATMHRADWLGGAADSHMRHQFRAIGEAIETRTGRAIFAVDAVLGQRAEVLDVQAGRIAAVEDATWPLARQRADVVVEELREPADVLLIGLPRDFHYGPGMGTNPILMGLAIGAQYSRCAKALRPDAAIIAVAAGDGWFNDDWFPSYEPTYEALIRADGPAAFLASPEAERISTDPTYLTSYSEAFTYHPFHAMSMISGAAVPAAWGATVTVVGAERPDHARGMGFEVADDIADALMGAAARVGADPRILATPECYSGGMAVNLIAAGSG